MVAGDLSPRGAFIIMGSVIGPFFLCTAISHVTSKSYEIFLSVFPALR
jgi:hypothetical protein